jgi:Raf kinase inhibitor-like YbhB/YbcL family protein
MSFALKTEAFSDGGAIPSRYTCDGMNLSPHLSWSGAPAGTMSFALIVDDPDAPGGTFVHWVFFDIPAKLEALPEGPTAAKLGVAGINDFGKSAYGGPCPPKGRGSHRYFFKLSALDIPTLGLTAGATLIQVNQKMSGHVLGTATIMGRYERR